MDKRRISTTGFEQFYVPSFLIKKIIDRNCHVSSYSSYYLNKMYRRKFSVFITLLRPSVQMRRKEPHAHPVAQHLVLPYAVGVVDAEEAGHLGMQCLVSNVTVSDRFNG